MSNITMFAPVGSGGTLQLPNSGIVFVKSDGTVSVDPRDANDLLKLGYQFSVSRHASYVTPGAPAAASATAYVSSVSVTSGASVAAGMTLTIAAQPVAARPMVFVFDPGTVAATAGVLTLTYTGNDGQTHVEALSLVTALSTVLTVATTYGVEHLTSAIISGLVNNPLGWLRGIGSNANLAVPVDARAVNIVGTRESILSTAVTTGITTGADETVGTIISSTGVWTPTTAPNATQAISIGYNYNYPG